MCWFSIKKKKKEKSPNHCEDVFYLFRTGRHYTKNGLLISLVYRVQLKTVCPEVLVATNMVERCKNALLQCGKKMG